MRKLVVLACILIGCGGPPFPTPEECPAEIRAAAEYEPKGVEQLFGLYRLTMAVTSFGSIRGPFNARLLLGPPDTLRHYYPERYEDARALLGQQIAGVWTQQGDSRVYVDGVSYENSDLYLGCRVCFDASPIRFTIERMGPSGFWGRWKDPQTGIARAFDTAGRELPNPAGVYCAVRESTSVATDVGNVPTGRAPNRMQMAGASGLRNVR